MTQKYQLLCSHCNATTIVEPRHAGSTVTCTSCQRSIDVPKLRELRHLEPLQQDTSAATPAAWGQMSGGLFVVGILLLAVALGSWIYLQMERKRYQPYTEKPKVEDANFSLEQASLTDTWQFWGSLLENRDVTLRNEPIFLQAREIVDRLDFWSKIFYGVATVGILAVIAAILARPKPVS